MALSFGASQYITTDFLLAGFEALAVWAFIESRWGAPAQTRHWLRGMWVAFALAFLTKGPPGLLPLAAMLAFDRLQPRGHRRPVLDVAGVALFIAIAAPWFFAVTRANPALIEYFVGDEVVNRVASDEFNRNGQWYGWLLVYAPTLLLGTLPCHRWPRPGSSRAFPRTRRRGSRG